MKMKEKISFLDLTDNLITTNNYLLNKEKCFVDNSNKIAIMDIIYCRSPKFLGEVIIQENHPNFNKITQQTYPQYKINLLIDKIDIKFSSNDTNPMEDIHYDKKFNEIKQLRRLENVAGENNSQDSIVKLKVLKKYYIVV